MQRTLSSLLIGIVLLLAWLLMQGVHELGHVVGAWLTSGEVERLVWHPLTISRTDLVHNPQPLLVVWAGPLLGVLLPLAIWAILAVLRVPLAWMAQFFAGFCLLANGLYIGVGSLDGIGDAGDMLRHGSPIWTLWLFGLAIVPAGIALWNGLGAKMGLGKHAEQVDWRIVVGCALALTILVSVLMLMSPL